MSISSMTGFARGQGHEKNHAWIWDAKSVNGKGREVRCRLPGGFDFIEPAVRDRVAARFHRGNISLSLTIKRDGGANIFQINHDVLDGYLAMVAEIANKTNEIAPPTLDGLLALRGVIETEDPVISDDERNGLGAAFLAGLDETLEQMGAMRSAEGARLEPVLTGLLDKIAGLCSDAAKNAALFPGTIRDKLKKQVAALLGDVPPLPEDRLAQEAALLMSKADVREELDRLGAHVEAARVLLASDGPVGRKLDFLCQEFNREANTLCSKSSDRELTGIGLELKAAIEQLREQVQNIE